MAQQHYWQQEVHYTIDVSLNDREHTLDGFLQLQYINHSPDTLRYIWFHIWPNAYKNDQTAFSEQLLLNGRTDFYFADKEKRGYINRLDFRAGNTILRTEDHPMYIDVMKVYLDEPLAPGGEVLITTPFHVKLPALFSRSGHHRQFYQVTQWYPKPAVYDAKGWHPMPYLSQGEFYSEFGSYSVRITLPDTYTVAATGLLQSGDFKGMPEKKDNAASKLPPPITGKPVVQKKKSLPPGKKTPQPVIKEPEESFKTLHYQQSNIHDFAWFAAKNFVVAEDTVQLPSGKVVQAYSFYLSANDEGWKNSMQFIKDALRFRSDQLGDYPYDVISVVQSPAPGGGMEYPTITNVSSFDETHVLDEVIQHEIGHNWFYGALASNERMYPWMDEGMNTFYDNRYRQWKYGDHAGNSFMDVRLPEGPELMLADVMAAMKEDQPISSPAAAFSNDNYSITTYNKAAAWLKKLEDTLGTELFDSVMRVYYRQWQFKHPYPEDFRAVAEQVSGYNLQELFALLDKTGPLEPFPASRKIKPVFLFSFKDYKTTRYIGWMPAVGYNEYDKLMAGLLVHNVNLPPSRFQFLLAPLYATNSKQLNGVGLMNYSWPPARTFKKIRIGISGARFSMLSGTNGEGEKVFGRFYRIAPSLRFTFKNKSPLSTVEKWIGWKTFFIGEQGLRYEYDSVQMDYFPSPGTTEQRYLNQLTFSVTNYRKLYPYDVQLQLQQGEGFYRANATAHYFFNYAKGGGMEVRLFAAKFGYLGKKTLSKYFETAVYHPKLTAVRGYDDYTYSNYFIGRNEFEGFAAQQIMIRDAGLKIRTDIFQALPNSSDNWIAAVNFSTTLPPSWVPPAFPFKIFVDAGTYADAWKKDAPTSRFLYVAGLQLSLFGNLVNIYAPVFMSSEFRNQLKTVPEENKFFKRLSFSIDIHRFNFRKLTGLNIPL